jgi:DNA-binding NarL/FixJ family response regulator
MVEFTPLPNLPSDNESGAPVLPPKESGTTTTPSASIARASSATDDCAMTTIAIVEDNAGLGASLRRIVERTPGCECVGLWRTGEEAVAKVPAFRPDVVLMDIHMPGISGIEATRRLKAELPELLVIMVTVYADHDKIFDALKAGACGYLLKCSTPQEVRQAIVDVRKGGAPMSPEIARRVVEAFHQPLLKEGEAMKLSPREKELLDLLSEGLSNKEIADRMGLSVETVYSHLKRVYENLHVHSRTEAVIRYLASNPRPQ